MSNATSNRCIDCSKPLATSGDPMRCFNCAEAWARKIRPAHQAVRRAIYRGELARQRCEVCGNPKARAHHDDYSKPLEVRWLCYSHHIRLHKAEYRAMQIDRTVITHQIGRDQP